MAAWKEVTPTNHLPSSTEFYGGENEKVSICLFILKSSVSSGFVFFVLSTFRLAFLIKVTPHYSSKEAKSISRYVFYQFLLFCERFLSCLRGSELFFIVFGLLAVSFVCSLYRNYFTLLSLVFFLNVIYFKENANNIVSFDSVNLKQQNKNQYLSFSPNKLFINNNWHKKNLFYLSYLVFCIQNQNNIHFVL